MNNQTPSQKPRYPRLIPFIVFLALILVMPANKSFSQGSYPPPEPEPTANPPIPVPLVSDPSEYAQHAIRHVVEKEGLNEKNLIIVADFFRDSKQLSRKFQAVKLLDVSTNMFYSLLVDQNSGEILKVDELERAEHASKYEMYGNIDAYLFKQLEKFDDSYKIDVIVWSASSPGSGLQEMQNKAMTLIAKTDSLRETLELTGKAFDVTDASFASSLRQEYRQHIQRLSSEAVLPLVSFMKDMGADAITLAGIPAIKTTLSKSDILKVAKHPLVSLIESTSAEGELQQQGIKIAVQNNRAPAVIVRGFDGTGASIAIVDYDGVDFDDVSAGGVCTVGTHNCFRNPGYIRTYSPVGSPTPNHATQVASAAASTNSNYPGMAPGALIHNAALADPSFFPGFFEAFNWALNSAYADIAVAPLVLCSSSTAMDNIDRYVDYASRFALALVTIPAGNDGTICPGNAVRSPGKAWNVLTVGAYDTRGNNNWSDDIMSNTSLWQNPASSNGDREKPEVVAPGVNLTLIGRNGQTETVSGTSFSTPQVGGMAALMIHRNPQIASWPEATRAAIMASATHNIEGTPGIVRFTDSKDGAGAINADLADTVATLRGVIPSTTSNACIRECWWAEGINSSSFDASGNRYYYFQGNVGDSIRVAASWWSSSSCPNPSTNCIDDRLATDLDLVVQDVNGNALQNAISGSFDNNYELVPSNGSIVLPSTGIYRIQIHKTRMDEGLNYVGIAWTRVPASGTGLTYNDRHRAIAYSGYWQSPTAPIFLAKAYQQTITYSDQANARVRFSFNGTRISYRHTMTSNRGGYYVYIDGEYKGYYNAYTAKTRWQAVKTWEVLPGDHSIEIVAAGGAFIDVDAFVVDTPYLTPGSTVDSSNTAWIQYIGTWTQGTSFPSAYNGTLHYSNQAEAEAGTTFLGSSVTYVFTKANNRGHATITIDGTDYGTVDLYSGTVQYQQSVTYYLPYGIHTIHVGVAYERTSPSTDYYIDFDRFYFN